MTTDHKKPAQQTPNDLPPHLQEITIVGAVGATGPGGGRMPPEELWTLHFNLIAWREIGQPIHKSPISISKKVTQNELAVFQENIKAESVVVLRVKLAFDSSTVPSRAELVSVLPEYKDEEILAFLEEYSKPIQISDSHFGTFTFNKCVEWFEGTADWCGVPIRLAICVDEEKKPEKALQIAKKLWKTMGIWEQQLKTCVVSELLELKNDSWLDDDEEPVTAKKFLETIQIESVTIYPDGEIEFWYDDGDLFLGHSIQVCGSLKEGFTEASIHG